MQDLATFLPLVLLAAAFWFLIIRPQRNRQKAQAELVRKVGPGAEIMTAAGIFGTVVSNEDGQVQVEVAPGVVLRMLPDAISRVVNSPDTAVEAPASDSSDQATTDKPSDQ